MLTSTIPAPGMGHTSRPTSSPSVRWLDAHHARVASASIPGQFHAVTLLEEGAECTCRGYSFRRQCRHITQALATRHQTRLCSTCGFNPVWDGLHLCTSCAAKAVEPSPTPIRDRLSSVGPEPWSAWITCYSCFQRTPFRDGPTWVEACMCPDCSRAYHAKMARAAA